MDNTDKVVLFIRECKKDGVGGSAPDINCGEYKFTVRNDGTIVYGLGA